nr:DM13 domain-containing protein [Virgisporangium aurantiacum]
MKRFLWVAIGVVAVAVGAGLYWFEPWRLVTSTTVNESLATPPAPSASVSASAAPAAPQVVLRGAFVTHEHETKGDVRVVRHPDGRHTLELVDLDTSDGPDLRVWLSDQPVREGTSGWRVFDDGRWVELGKLKGNRGNQVYEIPAEADLTALRSVAIWCKRFSVSFGAAALT